jgi:hypothetical protein
MEKYKPMPMPHMQQIYSAPAPMPSPIPSPGPSAMPLSYAAPVTLHASYEEINIYEQKKHHPHGHHCHQPVHGHFSAGAILVLYILLVIVLRGFIK